MLKIYETFRQNTAVAIFRVLQFLESYMGKAVTGEMELIAGTACCYPIRDKPEAEEKV